MLTREGFVSCEDDTLLTPKLLLSIKGPRNSLSFVFHFQIKDLYLSRFPAGHWSINFTSDQGVSNPLSGGDH